MNDIIIKTARSKTSLGGITFSGGEERVTLENLDLEGPMTVLARLQSSSSVMRLVMLEEILNRLHKGKRKLVIPYFPYARQDRITQFNGSFALKNFCSLINAMHYRDVFVYDPHSDVTPALLDKCRVITQLDIVKNIIGDMGRENCVVVAPDVGAIKKSQAISDYAEFPLVLANKVRNPETGQITRTEILSSDNLIGKCALIFDDICDGGRTFIELGKALRERGCSQVKLYVTHGIFSQGTGPCRGVIDKIYTTDTFLPKGNPEVITYPIVENLL